MYRDTCPVQFLLSMYIFSLFVSVAAVVNHARCQQLSLTCALQPASPPVSSARLVLYALFSETPSSNNCLVLSSPCLFVQMGWLAQKLSRIAIQSARILRFSHGSCEIENFKGTQPSSPQTMLQILPPRQLYTRSLKPNDCIPFGVWSV